MDAPSALALSPESVSSTYLTSQLSGDRMAPRNNNQTNNINAV